MLSFFPRDVLDESWDLIESVSEGFPTYSCSISVLSHEKLSRGKWYSVRKWGGRVVRWCWVNFRCRGVLLILITVGQEPTALAVGGGGLDIFLSSIISLFFLPLSGSRSDIN